MAFNANDGNKQVVAAGTKWTGLFNMTVDVVNPNMVQLKAMRMNPQKEPEYTTVNDERVSKTRLDIYLRHSGHKIFAKLALWLEGKERLNQAGTKKEWINKFGTTAWTNTENIDDVPEYDWFKKDGARPAIVGEATLIKFCKALANIAPEGEAMFANPMLLAEGKLDELNALLGSIKQNEVKVLLGVTNSTKDGKAAQYQAVYNQFFDRAYRDVKSDWKNALEGQYGKFDADIQNSLDPKPYLGGGIISTEVPTNMDQQIPGGSAPQGSSIPQF